MPDSILGSNPLRTPFAQAVKNLEARTPRGLEAPMLESIRTGQSKPRTDTSWNWHDTLAHQHADSFVVARMAQADLLRSVHASLVRATQEGWSLEQWKKSVTPQLQAAGWWGKQEVLNPKTGKMEMTQLGSPRRLNTIYLTNMRVSMMAAHYKGMMAASEMRPLWRYVAMMDKRTRPSHSALHNQVFRFDHPFWSTHFPPNGWGCRCTVTSETDESLANLTSDIEESNKGKTDAQKEAVPKIVPMSDAPIITSETLPRTRGGQAAVDLPKGVHRKTVPVATFDGMRPDPGWSYNPGQMPWARETMLVDKLRQLPEPIARASIDQMARRDYSQWSAFATAAKQQVGMIQGVQHAAGAGKLDTFAIRWMDSDLTDALRIALKAPGLDPILATDLKGTEHAVRAAKNVRLGSGSRLVPWDEYLKLPAHLAGADAVYLDLDALDTIVFASPLDGDLIKTVFRMVDDGERQTLRLVTSGVVKKNAFMDERRWDLIQAKPGFGRKRKER